MKCVIPSQNVKILGRAVHSLAKIGDEMYLEASEDELVLRTINMNKSAFGEFRMCRSFFSSYSYSSSQLIDPCCRVTMKSCLSVFKNAHTMEKQVENCEIRIKPDCTQVVFQLKFINSSMKKHYLPVIENDQLEAQIPTEAPNQLCVSSKFLSAALKNFRQSEDEISWAVTPEKTIIKNHLEIRRDVNLMRTELSYQPTEFESYVVGHPTNVTFCLKELRAVVMFAEPASLPLVISFSEPGRPIVFQVQNHPAYEANYVVSTLGPSVLAGNQSRLSGSSSSRLSRGEGAPTAAAASPVPIRTLQPSTSPRLPGVGEPGGSGFSFEEEEALRVPFAPRSSRRCEEQPPPSQPPPSQTPPVVSRPPQTELTKSIRFLLNMDTTQESGVEELSGGLGKDSATPAAGGGGMVGGSSSRTPAAVESPAAPGGPGGGGEAGSSTAVEGQRPQRAVKRRLSASPQPSTSKQADFGTPFSSLTNRSVVVESEPAESQQPEEEEAPEGGPSGGGTCTVETVIQGMEGLSQPSPELLTTVFSRCFSKDHFLNVLVGHDVLLEEASDREPL